MPLARASEAYARMMRGDARFRMVLTIECRSGGLAASAEAGHRHGQIGAGGGEVHALAD